MDKRRQGEKPRIVIDASVAAKWFIPREPWEAEAQLLRGMIVSQHVEAYAPILLLYEISSILLRMVLRGVLKINDAIQILEALQNLGLNIQTTGWREFSEIIQIAFITKLTVYDSVYLYLSKEIDAVLITADEELKKKGGDIAKITLLKDITTTLGSSAVSE
jgi:predicted nucleic acid-binding protein